MISGLHGVQMVVADLERGVDDVRRLLGRPPVWRGIDAESGVETGVPVALIPVGKLLLELIPATALGSGDDPRRAMLGAEGEGLCALRLASEQPLDAVASTLATRGLPGAIRRRVLRGEGSGHEGAEAGDRSERELRIDPEASRGIPVGIVSEARAGSGGPSRSGPTGEAEEAREAIAGAVEALDHVVVLSADLDATGSIYGQQGLGIRLALDRRFESRGVRLLFFRAGGITLEIGGRLAASPEPGARDRFGGLAWRVADANAVRTRLMKEGFDVSEVRDGHKPGTLVCTVRAPVHGVPTLLIEHL